MRTIILWPAVGIALIVAVGLLLIMRPTAVKSWVQRFVGRPWISRVRDRFLDQRDHLVLGLRRGPAFVLIVSASLPLVVLICFTAGMLVSHPPLWAYDGSLYRWFVREGPGAPSLLRFLRGVSWLGTWRQTLVISGLACIGLFSIARERRWLGPVLVATAVIVERDVQMTIALFVNQSLPPSGTATFPSGGTARIIAIYGFIAYLYLRLRRRPGWSSTVLVGTFIAVFAFLQGYARAALLLHWPFDIPGGWLLGVLLLATMIAASSVFDGWFFPRRDPSQQERARLGVNAGRLGNGSMTNESGDDRDRARDRQDVEENEGLPDV